MDEEEAVVQQIGLLLMQLRFARRALEEVERNTARYSGVSFTNALAAGPRFGEPPLLNGALKVHVVNISDLNPGTSIGSLIEGILGGIGRFFGGFTGGVVGGVASTTTLPLMLITMQNITSNINRILDRLDIIRGPGGSDPQAPTSGSGIDLNQVTSTLRALSNLFTAASSGPTAGGQVQGEVPEGWLVMLYTTSRLVESISRLVDGLILLIPIAIGAIASLILRLDNIKLKVLELIQFLVRNTFLLRGVTLVTIYDTLAGVARLGAGLMGIVGRAVSSIVSALFTAIAAVLSLAVDTLQFIGSGLQRTMNGLLEWLRTGLGTFLIDLGRTDIFRLLHHLVRVLPLILPSLIILLHGKSLEEITAGSGTSAATLRSDLRTAAGLTLPGSPLSGGSLPSFTPFPDAGTLMAPPAAVAGLMGSLAEAQRAVLGSGRDAFGAAQGAMSDIQRRLQAESESAQGLFARSDDPRLVALRDRAADLATALQPAVSAASQSPKTGLEAIARAYESWVSNGGLQTVLNRLTEHFRRTPTTGPDSDRSILGRIVAASAGATEPTTATIRIERVEIEVAPPPTAPSNTEEPGILTVMEDHFLSPAFVERLQAQLAVQEREWTLRGGDPRFVGLPASALT